MVLVGPQTLWLGMEFSQPKDLYSLYLGRKVGHQMEALASQNSEWFHFVNIMAHFPGGALHDDLSIFPFWLHQLSVEEFVWNVYAQGRGIDLVTHLISKELLDWASCL